MSLFTITEGIKSLLFVRFFKAEIMVLASGKQEIFFPARFTKQFVPNTQKKERAFTPSLWFSLSCPLLPTPYPLLPTCRPSFPQRR